MDYLTRRSVAARGNLGARLASLQAMRWPRLSSLGIRIEGDPEMIRGPLVCVKELRQALTDIEEQIELPAEKAASADSLEALLVKLDPAELDARICLFLQRLREEAERQIYIIRNLPEEFEEPFRQWLGKNIIRIEGGGEGYRQADLERWMDELRKKNDHIQP